MRKYLQDMYNLMAGRQVFIIGGGRSLHDFDFSQLNDKTCIAINAAIIDVPKASCAYWADESWAANNLKYLDKFDSPYRFHGRHCAEAMISRDSRGVAECTYLLKTGDFGLDLNPDNVKGNNSGAHAINFAVNMGAKEIVLLGFDMKYIERKSHYHDRHQLTVREDIYSDLFVPCIEQMAGEIKKYKKVDIINCSLKSSLKCFPKIEFSKL